MLTLEKNKIELEPRQNIVNIVYQGVNITKDIQSNLMRSAYRDSIGEIDSLDLIIDDREKNWISKWKPLKGDKIEIEYINKKLETLQDSDIVNKLGIYYLDTFQFQGPPASVNLKALSVPLQSTILDEKKVKVWENISLEQLAKNAAKDCKLKLEYYVDYKRTYTRLEQDESYYSILKRVFEENGCVIKIYKDKLIIWEETKMEEREAVDTLVIDECASYVAENTDVDTYSECVISYYDSRKNKNIEKKVRLSSRKGYRGDIKRTLLLHQDQQPPGRSTAQKSEYLKNIAKKALKKYNKEATTVTLVLMGKKHFFHAGECVNIKGLGVFDGKYLIKEVTVELSTYTVSLKMRATNTDDIDAKVVI